MQAYACMAVLWQGAAAASGDEEDTAMVVTAGARSGTHCVSTRLSPAAATSKAYIASAHALLHPSVADCLLLQVVLCHMHFPCFFCSMGSSGRGSRVTRKTHAWWCGACATSWRTMLSGSGQWRTWRGQMCSTGVPGVQLCFWCDCPGWLGLVGFGRKQQKRQRVQESQSLRFGCVVA